VHILLLQPREKGAICGKGRGWFHVSIFWADGGVTENTSFGEVEDRSTIFLGIGRVYLPACTHQERIDLLIFSLRCPGQAALGSPRFITPCFFCLRATTAGHSFAVGRPADSGSTCLRVVRRGKVFGPLAG